jgi:hypothetical protein
VRKKKFPNYESICNVFTNAAKSCQLDTKFPLCIEARRKIPVFQRLTFGTTTAHLCQKVWQQSEIFAHLTINLIVQRDTQGIMSSSDQFLHVYRFYFYWPGHLSARNLEVLIFKVTTLKL